MSMSFPVPLGLRPSVALSMAADSRLYYELARRAAVRRELNIQVGQGWDPTTVGAQPLHVRNHQAPGPDATAFCGASNYWASVHNPRRKATCRACIKAAARERQHRRLVKHMKRLAPQFAKARQEASYAAWTNRAREALRRRMGQPAGA